MKKLELNQMEQINGAFDCSNGNQAAFVAGAALGGAIFFGWGAIVTGYAAGVYVLVKCEK